MTGIADVAAALADTVQAALTAAGHAAAATTDPDVAHTAAASGDGAVLIGPPTINYSAAYGARDATYPVTVAYRGTGAWDAWQHIDALMSTVAAVVDLDNARPAQLAAAQGGDPIPAYIATTHPLTVTE